MKRILFLLTLMGFLSVNLFSQEIPKQFNYQGVLKEGAMLLDGNYPFTFRIYNEPTGGSALWTESQTILVENGLFSAHLGSVSPIAGVPFNRVHFLGITIGTGAELAPRSMLTPSAYSFMSMDVMDEAITTAKIHDGAVTGDKIGSNQVVKSLNGIKDDVILVGGTNITLTPSGNNITISAAGGGGGTVTEVNTGAGLTGGPITTTGTISVPNDGITGAMLQNNSVTSAKIVDATITGTDIANNTIGPEKLNFTPGTGTIGGSGTENYISRFTANTTLGNSAIYQSAASNIGIGTTEPTEKFHVVGNTLITSSDFINQNGSAQISLGDINNYIKTTYGGATDLVSFNDLRFLTGGPAGTEKMRITANGNVGIGTTTPTKTLDISDKVGIFSGLNGDPTFRGLGPASWTRIGGNNGGLAFWGNNNVEIDNIPHMFIANNGNVGIGTTWPTYPLSVTGNDTTAVIHSVNTHGTPSYRAAGVYGQSNAVDYYGIGGVFVGGYMGVHASVTPSGSFPYYGVYGEVTGGTSPTGSRYGVYGTATGTGSGYRYGVRASAAGGTNNYGIWASAIGGTINYAGYFAGSVAVTGSLSKGGGSFKIDHPLEPANKYLYHSFVESPDMMNIYNGNVITDGSGYATVSLPDWFEALNKDFRYQLTVIGEFSQAIIAQKVQGNQFAIRTDKPNIEVSWLVTGIRKDAWAEKNRIQVEIMKQGDEAGKYIHPEVFGLPETMGIDYERNREGLEREKDFR